MISNFRLAFILSEVLVLSEEESLFIEPSSLLDREASIGGGEDALVGPDGFRYLGSPCRSRSLRIMVAFSTDIFEELLSSTKKNTWSGICCSNFKYMNRAPASGVFDMLNVEFASLAALGSLNKNKTIEKTCLMFNFLKVEVFVKCPFKK